MRRTILTLTILLTVVTACSPEPAFPPPLPTYTGVNTEPAASPTPSAMVTSAATATPIALADLNVPALCAALDSAWGRDWERVAAVVDILTDRAGACGGQEAASKRYPAYYNLGAWLETQSRTPEAVEAYQRALDAHPNGPEAVIALRRLNSFTPPAPLLCSPARAAAAQAALAPYEARLTGPRVRLDGARFTLDGVPFVVRGINYYPSRGPWRRFLTETSLDTVGRELDLIREAGFNTIRIFAWHEALFECPQDAAHIVPRPETFAVLDATVAGAAERGLRILFTLNDLPDLLIRPVYDLPDAALAQMEYIVQRYRDEAAILAWDVRNEADVDYVRGYTTARKAIAFVKAAIARVRAVDSGHLITAGWNEHAALAAEDVDFVSFHHWRSAQDLQARITAYRSETDKPLLLQEVGYSTPAGNVQRQVEGLRGALTVSREQGLLGWLVWIAFDFPTTATCIPPNCPSPDNAEHHYGLWRADYTPKPALAVLQNEFGLLSD